ncbi:MAG: lysophospholipid acyltransferase family protein [Anaerolineales bacterium]|jgi:1-acyl-sn-glycerol-3-phosphate acyltransferase
MSSKQRSVARKTLNAFFYILTSLLCDVDANALKRIPERGPLILVSNHVNILEIPVLLSRLGDRPISGFFASYRLKSGWMRWLLSTYGGIPVHRGAPDKKALNAAVERIRAGDIFALAPEGTRSGDGVMGRGRAGVVLMALNTGAPILPVVHHGDAHWQSNLRRLRRTPFHIEVGTPFKLNPHGLNVDRSLRQAMLGEIMTQMAALLPPSWRGPYADEVAKTPNYLEFQGPVR